RGNSMQHGRDMSALSSEEIEVTIGGARAGPCDRTRRPAFGGVGTTGVHDLCGTKSVDCKGVTCGQTTCDASCGADPTPASGCTLVIHRTVRKPPRGGGGSVNR